MVRNKVYMEILRARVGRAHAMMVAPSDRGGPKTVIRALSTLPCDPQWVSEPLGPFALKSPKSMYGQAQKSATAARFCINVAPGFAGVLWRRVE
jgi:hypothetical protein